MHVEKQRTSFANILLKMNETGGLTQPGFKAYDKSHMNQGRSMVAEEIRKSRNSHTDGQLISIKGVKLIRWEQGAGRIE